MVGGLGILTLFVSLSIQHTEGTLAPGDRFCRVCRFWNFRTCEKINPSKINVLRYDLVSHMRHQRALQALVAHGG